MATLSDALEVYDLLQPLEDEGYLVALCGSTLRSPNLTGNDIDVLLIRQLEDALPPERVKQRLSELGLEDVRLHLNEHGYPDGLGYVASWRGVPVDVGVFGWKEE